MPSGVALAAAVPVAGPDLAPGPPTLGQGRLGIQQLDAPDAVLAVGQGEPRQLPREARAVDGLGHEQRELLAGRRARARELQLQPGDGGRRRRPLEAGEEQPLDRLGVGSRLGEAGLDEEVRGRAGRREGEIQGEAQPAPFRGEPTGGEARAEGNGEPPEHEPDRLELGDGGLDRQPQEEPLRRASGPERIHFFATGARPDTTPLLAESRHQRRRGELRRPGRSGEGRTGAAGRGSPRPA